MMTQREGEKYQNLMGNGKKEGKDHVLDGQWKVPLPSISFI
jgi:hypothetical protein